MKFTANGKQFDIDRRDVLSAVEGMQPEPIAKWAVEIEGTLYPVKQVFAAVTGLGRQDFIATTARTKLADLGFEVSAVGMELSDHAPLEDDDRTDVEIITDAVREMELGAIQPAGTEYGYPNLVLCLIDAIFSIGIKYTTTRRVVERFALWWESNAGEPGAESAGMAVSDFAKALGFVADLDDPDARTRAKEIFGNLNRTSSQSGILKAVAVVDAADVCLAYGIDSKDDLLEHYGDPEFEAAFRSLPGQASGISLRYLYMLAGHEGEAKPDRMILRFLERHLGRVPSSDAAVALLQHVVDQLRRDGFDITVRDLDNAIWRSETSSGAPVERSTTPRPGGRSKYAPLSEYLARQKADRVELKFSDIEEIIAAKLPPSAKRHAAFWANHHGGTHVWATCWMDAGWKVDSYSLTSEKVVFVRLDHDSSN